MKRKLSIIAQTLTVIPLLSGCLWILGEKTGEADYIIINKTDMPITITAYYSHVDEYIINNYKNSNIYIPDYLPWKDSIYIHPSQHHIDSYSNVGGCYSPDFSNYFINRNTRDRLVQNENINNPCYNDTVPITYHHADSIVIFFDNKRQLVIVNLEKTWEFPVINNFWKQNERSDEFCNRKKGCCTCIFTYIITEEMYELAVPIL